MTAEEIAELFREMEDNLFASMARNMGAHEAWEEEEGFEWVQWQAEQIKGLRAFREEIQDLVNATYDKAKPAMEQMLTDAYHYAGERAAFDLKRSTGRAIEQQFFGVSPKMRGVIDNVLNDIERTRYAAINRMNSGYTSMLQRADIYAQSGTMTIPQAVDMASKDFVAAGLNCVEYSNGNRVGIDSYVEMALRTSSRDAAAQAEGEKRDEWEEWLVISNVINTTCPKCMKWQGKVLIDDVYAHGKPDGKHKMLSEAKSNGFLHPNCRHKPRTYIPDVTKIPDQPEKAKTKEQYNAEQKQRYYERNIRKYKRLRECSLDADNKAKYDSKVKEWSKALDEHIESNPSLRKNPWRSSLRGNNTSIKNSDSDFDTGIIRERQAKWKNENTIVSPAVFSEDYEERISSLGESRDVTKSIIDYGRRMLEHREGTNYEDLLFVSSSTNRALLRDDYSKKGRCYPSWKMREFLRKNPNDIIGVHNHPNSVTPSLDDIKASINYKYGLILCHNGGIFKYKLLKKHNLNELNFLLDLLQDVIIKGDDTLSIIKSLRANGLILEIL